MPNSSIPLDANEARSAYDDAVRRNREAIARGANAPFGRGALLVLRSRWETAEAAAD